jgi:hypothetical protein
MGWTELVELVIKSIILAAIGTGAVWVGMHVLEWAVT